MILAALGAIHANLNALKAALDAIDDEGIQTTVCTGDCALGPQPNEVIALLRARQIPVVQGDTDRWLARYTRKRKRIEREIDPATLAALDSSYRICTSENLEWLAGLPHSRTLSIDGQTVALFHGTLSSSTARLDAEDADEIFRRQREIVPAAIFICGGGNGRFLRRVDDALFANPGPLVPHGLRGVEFLVLGTESGSPEASGRSLGVNSSLQD